MMHPNAAQRASFNPTFELLKKLRSGQEQGKTFQVRENKVEIQERGIRLRLTVRQVKSLLKHCTTTRYCFPCSAILTTCQLFSPSFFSLLYYRLHTMLRSRPLF